MQLLSEKILSFLFIIFLMNSLWQDPEINNFKIFTEAAASVHLLIATALLMTSRTREETLYFLAEIRFLQCFYLFLSRIKLLKVR